MNHVDQLEDTQHTFSRFEEVIGRLQTNFKMQTSILIFFKRHPLMTKALRIQIMLKYIFMSWLWHVMTTNMLD